MSTIRNSLAAVQNSFGTIASPQQANTSQLIASIQANSSAARDSHTGVNAAYVSRLLS